RVHATPHRRIAAVRGAWVVVVAVDRGPRRAPAAGQTRSRRADITRTDDRRPGAHAVRARVRVGTRATIAASGAVERCRVVDAPGCRIAVVGDARVVVGGAVELRAGHAPRGGIAGLHAVAGVAVATVDRRATAHAARAGVPRVRRAYRPVTGA